MIKKIVSILICSILLWFWCENIYLHVVRQTGNPLGKHYFIVDAGAHSTPYQRGYRYGRFLKNRISIPTNIYDAKTGRLHPSTRTVSQEFTDLRGTSGSIICFLKGDALVCFDTPHKARWYRISGYDDSITAIY